MKTADELRRITQKGYAPIKKISVDEWATENRIISAGNAEPGRWKSSRVPYTVEPMNAITQAGIHRVVLMWASQLSKSESQLNIIGRFAAVDPCTIIMVQPTLEMAEDFSKTRLSGLIRDTKCLRKIFYSLKETAENRSKNTIMQKLYEGGRVVLTGSNSAASLASRPARIVLCDEVDRFAVSAGREGDPIGLIQKRMSTFWNWLLVLTSTPTIEGESRIEREYLTGTQEEWQYECPNCKEYHLLEYESMTEEGRWRCPDCGLEFEQLEMMKTPAKYIAKNPEAVKEGIRSFHVNGFSSPWLNWKTIMSEWKEARGNPEAEKVIMNTRFGRTYKFVGAYSDVSELTKKVEEYSGEIPAEVYLLTCAVDVQDNRLEYEICGWNELEECYGIEVGKILGSPSQRLTWKKLDVILRREYKKETGEGFKVSRTFIDSGGHFTGEVYEYCKANVYNGVFPIKGQGGAGLTIIHKITQLKNGLNLVIIGVNEAKNQIFSRLTIENGRQRMHFGSGRGYDEIYFKQLQSEERKMKMINGQTVGIWENVKRQRNEALDLKVYNLAAYESIKKQTDWVGLRGEKPPERVKKKKISLSNINIWS